MCAAAGPTPLAAAARAQPRVAALSLDERLARAAESARALAGAGEAIVDLAVAEAGQARRFARRELASALALLAALPALAEAIRPRAVPAVSGATTLEWRPYGVVLGWHAANSPVWVPTLVAASALVGGNAVVARPSRRTAATTARVLEALAGPWPAGAVGRLELPPAQAEALIAHPGVHAVVAHASTATVKRHLARLGAAYAAGAPASALHSRGLGQRRAGGAGRRRPGPGGRGRRARRLRQRRAALHGGQAPGGRGRGLAGFSSRAWPRRSRALRVGDPEDEATDVAPLPEGPARARARAALAEALALGGEVVVGQGERGPLFTPTVVLLPPPARAGALWREESFAPLRGLALAADPDEALALANEGPYGLGAAVFGPAGRGTEAVVAGCARRAWWSTRARSTRTRTWWWAGWGSPGSAARGPSWSSWSGRAACTAGRLVAARTGRAGAASARRPRARGARARRPPRSRASPRRARRAPPPASR